MFQHLILRKFEKKALADVEISDNVHFVGHPNILATHYNTIEVTRASQISRRADCIVGVRATKACSDLDEDLKHHIIKGGKLILTIYVGEFHFSFSGRGLPTLTLSSSDEIVFRRSEFVSYRTMAVSCSAAAIDLPREMISMLQKNNAEGKLTIRAIIPSESPTPEPICIPW